MIFLVNGTCAKNESREQICIFVLYIPTRNYHKPMTMHTQKMQKKWVKVCCTLYSIIMILKTLLIFIVRVDHILSIYVDVDIYKR